MRKIFHFSSLKEVLCWGFVSWLFLTFSFFSLISGNLFCFRETDFKIWKDISITRDFNTRFHAPELLRALGKFLFFMSWFSAFEMYIVIDYLIGVVREWVNLVSCDQRLCWDEVWSFKITSNLHIEIIIMVVFIFVLCI